MVVVVVVVLYLYTKLTNRTSNKVSELQATINVDISKGLAWKDINALIFQLQNL